MNLSLTIFMLCYLPYLLSLPFQPLRKLWSPDRTSSSSSTTPTTVIPSTDSSSSSSSVVQQIKSTSMRTSVKTKPTKPLTKRTTTLTTAPSRTTTTTTTTTAPSRTNTYTPPPPTTISVTGDVTLNNNYDNINNEVSAKTVTKDIMNYFSQNNNIVVDNKKDAQFGQQLLSNNIRDKIDGLHILTILFQSARTKRIATTIIPSSFMIDKLSQWNRTWSERDISTFVYGVHSLECVNPVDSKLLLLGASKIKETPVLISSRSIGNALYGLRSITSDTDGVRELCAALSSKIDQFNGDLSGQDIGIGLFGLQGMSAESEEVRSLINSIALKISSSESELDAQAMSNALYGLQSMSSDYPEVLQLVSALSTKVSESSPELCAQAIGSALYGLQKLSSDKTEVRSLVAALAEKVETSTTGLDAQAIGNALFGLQRMKSNSPEVRTLVQAIATKLVLLEVQMDSKGIGAALYGLHSMSSDVPQVRALLAALADRISISQCSLSGQGIADALYGLYSMNSDCPELRALLSALSDRIDATRGKLDSQEIGNALYGLQGMSSEMNEVRVIVQKLAEKIRRSKAVLRSQHIGRALLGLQRFSATSSEVRYLLKQLSSRIAESDRTQLTGAAIADSLYGLQGLSSTIPEVKQLIEELAKKIAVTAAELTSEQLGRALFGLQALSTSGSIFEESAIGIDSDEVVFLLSTLWDKVKVRKGGMDMASIGQGLQGIAFLKDPIANNLRQYMYLQLLRLGMEKSDRGNVITVPTLSSFANTDVDDNSIERLSLDLDINNDIADSNYNDINDNLYTNNIKATTSSSSSITSININYSSEDIVSVVRSLRLNNLLIPKWLANEYIKIEEIHPINPIIPLSRADKLVSQRYVFRYPNENVIINSLIDGFRLDLYFPEVKLNIELDGPAHRYPSRERFDIERDQYLSKKGYKVIRVELLGRGLDEVVQDINLNLEKEKDNQQEKFIQNIYKKDSEIQKLYSNDKPK